MYQEDYAQSEDNAELIIQSTPARSGWLPTVAVGLTMLVVGMLAGYFGRPLVTPQPMAPTPVTVTDAGAPGAAAGTNPSAANLMDAVVAETRHFEGDPKAPVVIIEFGDFQ